MSDYQHKPPIIDPEPPPQFQSTYNRPVDPPNQPNLFQRAAGTLGIGAIAAVKLGKVLLTIGTMLISMWFYAQIWPWQFAMGFVICILIHELGHVFVAKAVGHKVSAPMFIPFMGALITTQANKSAWESALIGIGGPLFGCAASIGCWAIFHATGNGLFLGLAYIGFFMNLFNMMPVYPLDGGRIVGAVHPILWAFGLAGLVFGFITGFIRSPFIIILVVLSLDRLIAGLRYGSVDIGYPVKTTKDQRWTMGVAYVALAGILLWGMTQTNSQTNALQEIRERHEQRGTDPSHLTNGNDSGDDGAVVS